ncbi:MAG: hypothetical protein QOD63_1449 [Actinomycetota bacterium]|jgi:hypothetical protein|nr:hypothetical protein [Actinomycetota bacterium]
MAMAMLLLLLDVRSSGQGIVRPIRAGTRGPSAAAVRQDFPETTLAEGVGLDGQQFYAIARDPWHPRDVASYLDTPRYRYARPLLPVLAWLLHPSGGGAGLVGALVVVDLLGLFAGGAALGSISLRLGGPPWVAGLYPLLPGALWSLMSSVADGLAVALSLVVIALVLDGRTRLACCAAVGAVLTRETTILVPLALVLATRRRSELPLILAPATALVALLLVTRLVVPADGPPAESLVFPLTGLIDAVRTRWLHGHELIGMAATLSALTLGGYVLARRRGPVELRWVVAVQLAFLTLCSGDALGNDFGGTRSTLPLLSVGAVILASSVPSQPADG